MIKISIAELKRFKKNTQHITTNTILPILSYIKLDCGENTTLTKNNLHTFCIQKINAEFEEPTTMLLDEKMLFALCNTSTAEFITIKETVKDIIISDVVTDVSFQKEEANNYPIMPPMPDTQNIILNDEILEAVFLSKSYIAKDGSGSNYTYVHIVSENKKTYVFGTSNHIVYFKEFNYPLTNIILSEEAVNLICNYNELEYYNGERNDFFKADDVVFSFAKPECKSPALIPLIPRFKVAGDVFEISKNDFVSFCELINSLSPSVSVPICRIDDDGDKLCLSYKNENFGKDIRRQIDVSKSVSVNRFSFNTKLAAQPIKILPFERLRCKRVGESITIEHADDVNTIVCLFGRQES